jgi:ribosomal protein S20
MNPADRLENGLNRLKDTVHDKAGKALDFSKDKVDTELGIFLHKNIGTLFYFDSQVRRMEKEIIEHARNGEKEKAIEASQNMRGYIMYQLQHNRYYKSKMKEIGEKLEDRREELEEKLEDIQESKMLDVLERLNSKDPDEMLDDLDIDHELGVE